jgi:hypothetical protein
MNFDDRALYMIKDGRYSYADGCAAWVKSKKSLGFYVAKELVEASPHKLDTYLNLIKIILHIYKLDILLI